jgi:hypothetical protein
MGVSLWQLLLPGFVVVVVKWVIFGLSIAAVVYLIKQLVTMAGTPPRAAMPGARRLSDLPGYGGPGQGVTHPRALT